MPFNLALAKKFKRKKLNSEDGYLTRRVLKFPFEKPTEREQDIALYNQMKEKSQEQPQEELKSYQPRRLVISLEL